MHPIVELIAQDRRYKLDAYHVVRDALELAQRDLTGTDEEPSWRESGGSESAPIETHLTGQQLCDAIRRLMLDNYGYMARVVLKNWGVTETGDFGEIVYNLIRIGLMKKSKSDRREDFNDVYDFEEAFERQFQITMPE